MIRSILNGNGRATNCLRLMSNQQFPLAERLFVELCGQISQAPKELENGNVVFRMRTRNAHEDFHGHQVILPTPIVKNIPDGRLREGERVFVTGVIYYKEFQCAGDRIRTKQHGQILSNNLIVCKPCQDPAGDINDVVLYGHIKRTPRNTENITFLDVNTRFFDAKKQEYKSNLHNVVIMNDDKMRELANRLEFGSRLSVHGSLETRIAHDDKGKPRGIYSIRPRRLIVDRVLHQRLKLAK